MRARLLTAVAGAAVVISIAPAQAKRPAYQREYLSHYAQLVNRPAKWGGVDEAGCNLLVKRYHNRCAGKTTRHEVVESNTTLERLLYVPPAPTPASSTSTSSTQYSVPSTGSGGGTYCGLFQFDQGTWESVGGSGSPCAASPDEQWSRAQQLQRERGNSPWPVCGQGGASLDQIAQCESGGDPNIVG